MPPAYGEEAGASDEIKALLKATENKKRFVCADVLIRHRSRQANQRRLQKEEETRRLREQAERCLPSHCSIRQEKRCGARPR